VPRLIKTPEHWRDRAQDSRALAGQMDDPKAKRALPEIAGRYDQLAKRAEKR
jgi:hypothetical protein